jgi:hypothetical protein
MCMISALMHSQPYGSLGALPVPYIAPYPSHHRVTHPRSLALTYRGECNPSSLKHTGAGQFWDDIWMIETGAEIEPDFAWKYVQMPLDKACQTSNVSLTGVLVVQKRHRSRLFGDAITRHHHLWHTCYASSLLKPTQRFRSPVCRCLV